MVDNNLNVIILAAGMGTRLSPYTYDVPKSLFSLGNGINILQRNIDLFKNISSNIYVVCGFYHHKVIQMCHGAQFIINPFYASTNSISSLWFARDHISSADHTIIVNGDVVINRDIVDVVCNCSRATIFLDSAKCSNADYKIATYDSRVVMMGKDLNIFTGEYIGIASFDNYSAVSLQNKINRMIYDGHTNEWYETALVKMILDDDFNLQYHDIIGMKWIEIDTPDDLLVARIIYESNK